MKTLLQLLCALVTFVALVAIADVACADDVPLPVRIDGVGAAETRAALRVAIEHELGRPIELVEHAPESGSALHVTIDRDRATLVYARADGTALERSVDLPRDEARRIETIALLSGNLIRNEAEELVEELRKQADARDQSARASDAGAPADAAAPSAEPPSAEPPKPPPRPVPPPPKPKSDSKPIPPPPKPKSAQPLPVDDLIDSGVFAFDASLAHPIALLPDAERRRINLEIGMAYGRVGAIRGIGMNVFLLRVDRDVRGVTYATLWNSVGGDVVGAQLSGLISIGGGNLHGASMAGLVDLRGGRVDGAQVSGIFNFAHDVKGMQISAVNRSAHLEGGQFGAVNLAGDGRIAQGAAVNVAGDVAGLQVGATNVARNFDGAQIGVVNVARKVRGAQIGVVNVSDEIDGAPVGVVNVSKKGHIRTVAWADARFPVSGGVRFEPNALVTTLGGGYDPTRRAAAAEAGIGGRLKLGAFFGDLDALYAFEHLNTGAHRHGVRTGASLGVRLYSFLGLFAGGGVWQTIETNGSNRFTPDYHAGLELF